MTKNKSTNEQEIIGQTTTEGLEDFYEKEPNVFKRPLLEHLGFIRVYYFVVCLLLGVIGGILGELFVNNYFSSQGLILTSLWQPTNSVSSDEKQQVIILRTNEINKAETTAIGSLVEAAGASVVGIFPKKTDGETIWDNIYLPQQQLGNGLILTSDGWIVTSDQVIGESIAADLVIVMSDKTLAEIESIVPDTASGAVFIKARAQGLKVVKFGTNQTWSPGEQLLVLANSAANGGYKTVLTNLEKTNYQQLTKGQDLLQSTEIYKKSIVLKDKITKEFFGSPAVNLKGEIIGILYGGAEGNILLPESYFSQAMKNLLASGQIDRPYLGVNYLDLAHIVGLDSVISEGRKQGAVLYGEKGTLPAVIPNSPAAKAGLKAGDIISKVNNEPVDAAHSLTEIVQQYKIGDALKFTIIFQGTEREVEVVLTAQPEV